MLTPSEVPGLTDTHRNGRRIGAQLPPHRLTPTGPVDWSPGWDAIAFGESVGIYLDPWQAWCVLHLMAEKPDGLPASPQGLIIIPRQNGKNVILMVMQLYGLVVLQLPEQIHSAHETETAQKHQAELFEFLRNLEDFDDPPCAFGDFKNYEANGKEKLVYTDPDTGRKSTLRFSTRTDRTKRGKSPQRIYFDEALYVTAAQVNSLVPSAAAQSLDPEKSPQLIFTSSAPLAESVFLNALRDACRNGNAEGTFYAEWSVDPPPPKEHGGPDLATYVADVELWYATNPSLGIRISEEYVRVTEFLLMVEAGNAAGFGTERLGIVHAGQSVNAIISDAAWEALGDEDSRIESDRRWALEVSPDRKWSTVSVAGYRGDGIGHIEFMRRQPGTAWVAGYVLGVWRRKAIPIHIRPSGPAGSFVAPLRRLGVEVTEVSESDFARSTARLLDAMESQTVRHNGDQPALKTAVMAATLKQSPAGGVVLDQRTSRLEITPIVACCLAFGALDDEAPAETFTPRRIR